MTETKYLHSYREICRECRIGYKTFRDWVKDGAPIRVEKKSNGKLRYRAEKNALMAWALRTR